MVEYRKNFRISQLLKAYYQNLNQIWGKFSKGRYEQEGKILRKGFID